MHSLRTISVSAMILLAGAAAAATPQGTSFTYQGELKAGAALVSGRVDMRFALFADAEGTAPVGSPICVSDVNIVNGRMNQTLDFGDQFQGAARYLSVSVRQDPQGTHDCSDPNGFTELLPRQLVSTAPVAIDARLVAQAPHAATADQANQAVNALACDGFPASNTLDAGSLTGAVPTSALSGTYAQAVSLTNVANVFKGTGQNLTNVSAVQATSATTADTTALAANTNALNGLIPSKFIDFVSLTGGLPSTINFASPIAGPVTFTNASNTFAGDGSHLSNMNAASMTTGALPNSAFASANFSYSQPVNFSNPNNVFSGDGYYLTNLNPQKIVGRIDRGRVSSMFAAVTAQSNASQAGVGASGLLIGSDKTYTAPFDAHATLTYYVSGYNNTSATSPTPLWLRVRPIQDALQLQGVPNQDVNFYFNEGQVHESMSATVGFDVAAGQHTLSLQVYSVSGPGTAFYRDGNDQVSWSLILTRK